MILAGIIDSSEFHKTFSGTDMVASIVFPGTKAITIGELTTISYSVYREKAAVRTFSYINVRGFTKGPRTVAGTMIFTVFDKHIVNRLRAEVPYFTDLVKMKADELPPFDIYITMGNEYGASARLNIYGLTVVDEGQVMSVEDLFTENQWSFMARNIDLQDEIGAEQYMPSTTMNHQEAVPTFKADSLVLDDDFEAMKKEMDKMKADAKAAVDAARAATKQAYTAEAAQFALAQVPTDKFDGWKNTTDIAQIPDGIDPNAGMGDFSPITDITVELLEDTFGSSFASLFKDANDRIVYVNAYAKGSWWDDGIPSNIQIGLGLADGKGNDINYDPHWKSTYLEGNDGNYVADSPIKAIKFTIKGYYACTSPPNIYVQIASTEAQDADGKDYVYKGENPQWVHNNTGNGDLSSDPINFIFLNGEDAQQQDTYNSSNISCKLQLTGEAIGESGAPGVCMYYNDSWTKLGVSFELVNTVGEVCVPWGARTDAVMPQIAFEVDASDGSLTYTDKQSMHIKAPVTLYFHTVDGDYSVGGNSANSNLEGTAYASAALNKWSNTEFDMSLNAAQTGDYLTNMNFVFDNQIVPFWNAVVTSPLKDAYDAINAVYKSRGTYYSADQMYLIIGPFRLENDNGKVDCDFDQSSFRIDLEPISKVPTD